MQTLLVLTHCYPQNERDSAGIFVKDWVEMVRDGGYKVEVLVCEGLAGKLTRWRGLLKAIGLLPSCFWSAFRKARAVDLVAAHWIFPSGLLAVVVGFLRRKPVYVIMHAEPFVIEKRRWVRVIAKMILHIPAHVTVQVVSTPCRKIVEQIYRGRLVVAPMPCRLIP